MGFFSSLRHGSKLKEPANDGTQSKGTMQAAQTTMGENDIMPVPVPVASQKKESIRWPASMKQKQQNQQPSIIPQTQMGVSHAGILDPQLPEPKSDVIKLFQLIEKTYSEQFELAEIEPANREARKRRDVDTQRKMIKWQEPGSTYPSYPPCLKTIPLDERTGLLQIFNLERLLDTSVALLPEVPMGVSAVLYGEPIGYTMGGLEARMRKLTRSKKNIGTEPSIANRDDWYCDAVFAQQSFTGPNPTSICLASKDWIEKFKDAARSQSKENVVSLLKNARRESMLIQDYSYFRNAANAAPDSTLQSDDMKRFGCASVTLFQLSPDGCLHPLAIVLDYRVSMERSVCVFNQRLTPMDPIDSESTDWPWRYAKMCNQVSDWTRHELQVHLNDCHFIEEAVIVAAQRSMPPDHIIYQLLEPHWLKTLSLNAAARTTLVPEVVTRINGFSRAQTYNFILDAYEHFNWTASYIPTDLASRGFPTSNMDKAPMHNYAWARNMIPMWKTLCKFVRSVLSTRYHSDAEVAADKALQMWSKEMQSSSGAQLTSFPDIKTMEDLTNVVTMCIHIASPQHNSVNYLQCYYMSFVPAKPPCLMAPLPKSLGQLMAYKEADVLRAIPIQDQQVWLLASQLPYLLSYGVSEDQTLLMYAKMLEEHARGNDGDMWKGVEKAANTFYNDLLALGEMFRMHSMQMDDRIVPYNVMDPTEMAVSILI